jgi:hypothetical protein
LLLEVALISAGGFLALRGDVWRERAQHRELATTSLRHSRSEFATNRDAVAAVRGRHIVGLERIQTYLDGHLLRC